jgi:type II secretory pathway component PulF
MSESSVPSSESVRKDHFPENELPKWLFKHLIAAIKRLPNSARPPLYGTLASFSRDLATCVRSGVHIDRGLEVCIKGVRRTRLGDAWLGAVDSVRQGKSLADALSGAQDILPPFYLQVIRAGEQTGRLDDALTFLESHCRLLAGPASALRSLWVFPVAILLVGSVIKVLLTVYFDSIVSAASVFVAEVLSWLWLGILVAVLTMTPARYLVDQIRLSIPFLGGLEREIALHRFFRVLALLYSVSGHRVEEMVRMSAGTVSNHAARLELLKAATAIERDATITDAFHGLTILTWEEKKTIASGELTGTLEQAFDRVSDETGASMLAKLNFIQPYLIRIVFSVVMFSILGTLLRVL